MEAQRREMGRTWPEWEEQEGTGAAHMPGSAASRGPLHVRREGEATSRNDPKSFYHLNIFLDFLEGEEAPEPCASHRGLKSLVSLAAPPFCPRGS